MFAAGAACGRDGRGCRQVWSPTLWLDGVDRACRLLARDVDAFCVHVGERQPLRECGGDHGERDLVPRRRRTSLVLTDLHRSPAALGHARLPRNRRQVAARRWVPVTLRSRTDGYIAGRPDSARGGVAEYDSPAGQGPSPVRDARVDSFVGPFHREDGVWQLDGGGAVGW